MSSNTHHAFAPTHATLLHVLCKHNQTLLQNIVIVVVATLALWASAKIQIPFYPVPLSMQTFVVLIIGMVFGWKLGAITMILYLVEGLVGLPVFAGTPQKGIGLAYMLGTTGGYLVGFVLAATATGWLAQKGFDRSIVRTAIAFCIGNVLIYVPGLLWLGVVVGWDKPILAWGLMPFVFGDVLKLILAASLMPTLWYFFGKNART